jgi:carbon-monoxide dehydrogenase small subunit
MSAMTQLIPIELTVNGRRRTFEVAAHHTLLEALRDDLELTGTKECCLVGECGACTVRLDDRIVDSCLVLAVEADGGTVTTVEGLAAEDGRLSPLQQAFLDYGAAQCGFCIPGQLMAADDLLRRVTDPSVADIQDGLAGNLCRCAGYEQITEAVQAVVGGAVASSTTMAAEAAAGAGGARAGTRTSAEGLDQ